MNQQSLRVLESKLSGRRSSNLQQQLLAHPANPTRNQSNTHPHRMRLGIEHPSILPIRTRNLELSVLIRVNQVCVLEHFSKEEGLLEVGEVAAIGSVDVGDGAVAAADAGVLDDILEAGEGPLQCVGWLVPWSLVREVE
jgi:hypothetical protein